MIKNLFTALGLAMFLVFSSYAQSITTENQHEKMIRSEQQVTKKINASAAEVWDVLKTGDDVDKWLPHVVKSCRLEGNIRYCGTDYGMIKEEILTIDHERMELTFVFIDQGRIKDVENLTATAKVLYDAEEGHAFVNYRWTFLAKNAAAETEAKKQLMQMGKDGIASLENYILSQRN